MSDLADRIRVVADPLIEQGATPDEVRAEVARVLGLGIGGGGHGSSFGQSNGPQCPYCGQTGGGGHGGLCPNGAT